MISLVKPYRFSILGALCDNLKVENAFEFILDYPYENVQLHWKQEVNPLNSNSTETKDSLGFEPLHIDENEEQYFIGLHIAGPSNKTLLAGVNFLWFYSIGTITNEYAPKIPSYMNHTSEEARLYLRINSYDDLSKLPKLGYTASCQRFIPKLVCLTIFIIGIYK